MNERQSVAEVNTIEEISIEKKTENAVFDKTALQVFESDQSLMGGNVLAAAREDRDLQFFIPLGALPPSLLMLAIAMTLDIFVNGVLTKMPTTNPTKKPTNMPSDKPSKGPGKPTSSPKPSARPSHKPSISLQPSRTPNTPPSDPPSDRPTNIWINALDFFEMTFYLWNLVFSPLGLGVGR